MLLLNSGYTPQNVKIPDVTVATQDLRKIQQSIYRFYRDIQPADQPAFSSPLTDILSNEARADMVLVQVPPSAPSNSNAAIFTGTRPLRLLSLGE